MMFGFIPRATKAFRVWDPIPVEITAEDVLLRVEPEPDECGFSPCTVAVTWPSYWCQESHYTGWLAERARPEPEEAA
jgi:hypothetical protein